MPQLVKGGKWVFGWVVVGSRRAIRIPPQAFEEYRFRVDEPVAFLPGSRRSGGFGVGRLEKLHGSQLPMQRFMIGEAVVEDGGSLTLPSTVKVQTGDWLLAVRGSRCMGCLPHAIHIAQTRLAYRLSGWYRQLAIC